MRHRAAPVFRAETMLGQEAAVPLGVRLREGARVRPRAHVVAVREIAASRRRSSRRRRLKRSGTSGRRRAANRSARSSWRPRRRAEPCGADKCIDLARRTICVRINDVRRRPFARARSWRHLARAQIREQRGLHNAARLRADLRETHWAAGLHQVVESPSRYTGDAFGFRERQIAFFGQRRRLGRM